MKLTCKCSKCIRGQFPEDDWVGGPVSLEHLRETKKLWYYSFLFHHWRSQVLVSMIICVHLGHCHIHYIERSNLKHVSIYSITYKLASLTVFRLTENLLSDYAYFMWQDFIQSFSTQPTSLQLLPGLLCGLTPHESLGLGQKVCYKDLQSHSTHKSEAV